MQIYNIYIYYIYKFIFIYFQTKLFLIDIQIITKIKKRITYNMR